MVIPSVSGLHFPFIPQLKALLDHPLVRIRSLVFTRTIELEDLQGFAPALLKAKIDILDLKNCSAWQPRSPWVLAPFPVVKCHSRCFCGSAGSCVQRTQACSCRSRHLPPPPRTPAEIGPKGFFAIATALEQNSSITSLNLRKNDLGPFAGAKVGQMLRNNTALQTLNVSVNNIRSEGCMEARTLTVNVGGGGRGGGPLGSFACAFCCGSLAMLPGNARTARDALSPVPALRLNNVRRSAARCARSAGRTTAFTRSISPATLSTRRPSTLSSRC